MRHHSNTRKFGREKNLRRALMESLARNLIKSSKIRTTTAKAKELRPFVEKMITRAKNDTQANRRLINSDLKSVVYTKKLFDVIAPKYKSRNGGYTRVIRTANRDLDGSPMSLIEFI